MKKMYTCFFIGSSIAITACQKDTQPTPVSATDKTVIEITVKDGNSFANGTNDTLNNVSGATVKLYDNKADVINSAAPKYILTTDAQGKASLTIDPSVSTASTYYFTSEKGTAKNILNHWLVTGVYTWPDDPSGRILHQQIPVQNPAPKLGSPLFQDADNDGIVQSPGDDVYSDFIIVSVNKTVTKKSIIF